MAPAGPLGCRVGDLIDLTALLFWLRTECLNNNCARVLNNPLAMWWISRPYLLEAMKNNDLIMPIIALGAKVNSTVSTHSTFYTVLDQGVGTDDWYLTVANSVMIDIICLHLNWHLL